MTKTDASERQAKWRATQDDKGLEQVRIWVPKKHATEIKAVAAAMRGATETIAPWGKQKYRMAKAEKQMRTRQIPQAIKQDGWRLEVWLIQNGY